jgi:hypothetical protein
VSPGDAVLVVGVVQTVAGLGVLAAIGVGSTARELLRYAPVAPLAGMAWMGVLAATLATLGSRLGIGGMLVVTVATCATGALRVAWRAGEPATAPAPRRRSSFENLVVAASLLAIGVVTLFAVALFRIKPLAEYDGWAMWGMKSRAIAALGAADPALFASQAYARLHLEYPLLLPSLHALPLQLLDGFESNAVVLGCLSIGLAGLMAIWGLLRDRVRASLLLPILAALTTAPAFFGQLATGYADVPLAVFVASGVVASARWLLDDARMWLALTTLFVTAATLTKNEGLLFAAATYVALLVTAERRRGAVLVSGAIVALAYAPWRAYVAIHDLGAPDYDLSSSLNLPWVVRRLDRAPEAAEGLLQRTTEQYQFGFLLLLCAASVVVALLFGPRRLGTLGGAFGLVSFAGLTWIYVLTPNDVSDYLSSNGDRIIVSLVVGLTALAPLLLEESTRRLAQPGTDDASVMTAPGGSSSPSASLQAGSPRAP